MSAALQLGKRVGWALAATSVNGLPSSRLRDAHTNTRFLIDTGSEVSVIPPTPGDRRRSTDPRTLTAVNNSSIRTYGQRSLTLNLGLRRALPRIFIIADVQKPIIGADFLRHYELTVDMHKHKLTDTHTCRYKYPLLRSLTQPQPLSKGQQQCLPQVTGGISCAYPNFSFRHASEAQWSTTSKLPVPQSLPAHYDSH